MSGPCSDDTYERGVRDGRREVLQDLYVAFISRDWGEVEDLLSPLLNRHCFELADLQSEADIKRLEDMRRKTTEMLKGSTQ